MHNNNFLQENYDFIDPSFLSSDLPFCVPSFEGFPDLPDDFFNYSDLESIESAQVYQLFDQAFQNYTKEIIKLIPTPIEPAFPYENEHTPERLDVNQIHRKIGTLTFEERRIKILRYMEKRKRRVYTKKISYLCRKKVADQRARYKGRFISKKVEPTEEKTLRTV